VRSPAAIPLSKLDECISFKLLVLLHCPDLRNRRVTIDIKPTNGRDWRS